MTQITVHFDKPEKPQEVADELEDYLSEVGRRIDTAHANGDLQQYGVCAALYELLERLHNNLQGV
jgi:hypothetical protein